MTYTKEDIRRLLPDLPELAEATIASVHVFGNPLPPAKALLSARHELEVANAEINKLRKANP